MAIQTTSADYQETGKQQDIQGTGENMIKVKLQVPDYF